MDEPITLTEVAPSAGALAAAVTVSVVRTGQPRPYADHENVYRVRISRINSYTNDVTPGRYIQYADKEREADAEERIVLALLGFDDHPRGKPADTWYAGSWIEYVRRIGDGEWEVMTKSTYFD